jgi:prolipoprotein diacylglyceryl transferase
MNAPLVGYIPPPPTNGFETVAAAAAPLASIPPPPTNGFHVGPLFFHLYGLCIAVGVLAAFWLANRRWVEAGGRPGELERPALWAVVAGFLGGRLGYVLTHTGDFRGRWLHVLAIWEGGLALYGGLTVGILTGLWVARRRGLPVLRALDAAIPAIPLAQAFGRWGNYFNQELFGTPTTLPWALRVDPGHRPERYAEAATFHPTFLYESLWDLAVVGILLRVSATRRLRPGSLSLLYLLLYGVGRFGMELLRTDTTFRFLGLSRNGWISAAVVLGASAWLWLRERHHPPAEAEAEAGPEADGGAGGGDAEERQWSS